MRVRLSNDQSSFRHLPETQIHWDSFVETEGINFTMHVYGVEYRDGEKLYLLIPDRRIAWDVLYSNACQYDVVDKTVPDEWGVSINTLNAREGQDARDNVFWTYPILRSSEDFIWRLSEADLTDVEKSLIIELLETTWDK